MSSGKGRVSTVERPSQGEVLKELTEKGSSVSRGPLTGDKKS